MLDRAEAERQLTESLRVLELAVAHTPERWRHAPPGVLRVWDVAQNLAHLAIYEEQVAAPILEALADGGDASDALPPPAARTEERDTSQLSREPIDAILTRLRAARRRQVAAVRRCSEERFATPLTPHWAHLSGDLKSPSWVASKTVQHTWEHGSSVMQTALFWPR